MRRIVAVVVLVLATMMFAANAASAHAVLVSSSPTDGADLPTAPTSMTLAFDEQVLPESAEMILYSGQGAVLARSGAGAHPLGIVGDLGTGPSARLTVSLPPLGAGAFALDWQVQSADDLHRSTGSIVFGVGQAVGPSAVDRVGPLPAAGGTLLRWLDLVALAFLLGALLLAAGTVPRSTMGERQRVRWLDDGRQVVHFSAGIGVIMAVAVLIDSAGDVGLVGHIVTSTAFGHLWLVHVAGLVGVFVLSRRPTSRMGRVLILSAVLAAIAGLAAGSHVGTGGDRPLAAALLGIHLAAGCGWAGAVVLLTVATIRSRLREQVIAVVKAFAVPAASCVAVVVTTGLALGARQVASADALIGSSYGRILIIKLVLVAAAGLLGFSTYVRFRQVHGRDDPVPQRRFARRTVLEGSVLVLVLGAAAALSLSSPPRGPAFAPAVPTPQTQLVTEVDGLLLTLDFSPGSIGDNWVRVAVDDTRRPARAPITAVAVALHGPAGQSLPARALTRAGASNRWQLGGIGFDQTGAWRVTLSISRPGLANATWQPVWTAGSRQSGVPGQVLSDRPLAALLDALAALLGLGCAGAALVARRRRRCAVGAGAPDGQSVEKELVSR